MEPPNAPRDSRAVDIVVHAFFLLAAYHGSPLREGKSKPLRSIVVEGPLFGVIFGPAIEIQSTNHSRGIDVPVRIEFKLTVVALESCVDASERSRSDASLHSCVDMARGSGRSIALLAPYSGGRNSGRHDTEGLADGETGNREHQGSNHFSLRCTPNVLSFSCERT
jgi:hypothetical protein